jgi:hypothetical protein
MSDRPTERVEFIDTDPHAFGRQASGRPPQPAGRGRAVLAVVAAVAVVLIAVVVWWSRTGDGTDVLPTTTVVTVPVTTVPITAPAGRVAPGVVSEIAFSLSVQPSVVPPAGTVTMQLTGDLTSVTEQVAAVAWLDRMVDGRWRTAYWLARSSQSAQQVRGASGDRAEAGPDAVTVAADAPVSFTADVAAGKYRMCRYVPLRRDPATGEPNPPAYVCAPLIVVA